MKKHLLSLLFATTTWACFAQITFPIHIDTNWNTKTVWMPKSPLKSQVVFVGSVDTVQTTATYGNPAGKTLAKQWHDFIGFVKNDNPSDGSLGWVLVNHEMIQKNAMIGDGGGMTSFKVKRKADGSLEVIEQTLADGRKGKFFNVDFANTVGETGMNCGGIHNLGRVWTAEEWMQSSNAGIFTGGVGFTDTQDFIIGTTTPAGFPGFNGKKLKRFENLNWMVEIDPKNAKAIRKQYNWGRAGWEGGVLMDDNKTVYLFEDNSPAILAKFVATTAGDFTQGQLYVHKSDAAGKWIPIENNLDTLKVLNAVALRRGATMFNRLEWGQKYNGKIYITETGRDAFNFNSPLIKSAVVSQSLIEGYKLRYAVLRGAAFPGTDAQAADSVRQGKFNDYYGRVLELDVNTGNIRSFLEGGPYWNSSTSQNRFAYPLVHLSNPDGLDFAKIGNKTYMIIQEDLNGTSFNRMPANNIGVVCETYFLDMSISKPTINDLIRVTACPPGAEITGATFIDENTMLVNSQHPNTSNTPPYNNSLTYAITGFNQSILKSNTALDYTDVGFKVYPNPTSRELVFEKYSDIAVYDVQGKRIKIARNTKILNVQDLAPGTYFIQTETGAKAKFIVE